jgi:hypothetical protein
MVKDSTTNTAEGKGGEVSTSLSAPDFIELGTISWQLKALAFMVGEIPKNHDLHPDHFYGLMTLLYDIAHKLSPVEVSHE